MEIFWTTHAKKDFDSIKDKKTKSKIKEAIYYLPSGDLKKLKGSLKEYWRVRTGNYRVIFEINDGSIVIVRIRHRKDVYEKK
jgi:mRNA-degrading endonuclease RelE of RelBE toxin-antitoxin system